MTKGKIKETPKIKDNRKNILITPELRDKLKLAAAQSNMTMRDFLERGIDGLVSKLTTEEKIVFEYEVKLERKKEQEKEQPKKGK